MTLRNQVHSELGRQHFHVDALERCQGYPRRIDEHRVSAERRHRYPVPA